MKLNEQLTRIQEIMGLINESDLSLYVRRRLYMIDELVKQHVYSARLGDIDFKTFLSFVKDMVIKDFANSVAREADEFDQIKVKYGDEIKKMINDQYLEMIKQFYLDNSEK